MVNLGALGDGSRASAVSSDGNMILGFDCSSKPVAIPGNCRRGFVHWYGSERLLHPYGWAGEALATNNVGSIIVGNFPPANAYASFGGFTTYMYTAWDGRFEDLGAVWQGPPGMNTLQYQSAPSGVSDDGSVVVGNTGSSQRLAFLWTRATGMVNVQDFLTSNGVTNHAGWILTYTAYVSPDGKTIAGVGINPDQIIQSWTVTLR
jgi:probable HAF family extracellular repeat protein